MAINYLKPVIPIVMAILFRVRIPHPLPYLAKGLDPVGEKPTGLSISELFEARIFL